MTEIEKESTARLKESIKEFVDGIDENTYMGKQLLKMTYGFSRRCFLEIKKREGGAV